MKVKILIILLFTISVSCKSDDDSIEDYPECLLSGIIAIMERPVQNPKATVKKYLYNGQKVYQVNGQNFPDGQSSIITSSCQVICVLGGIDGPLNDCENWIDAEFIETIWTDPR